MIPINFLGSSGIMGVEQGYEPLPVIIHKEATFSTITSIWEPSVEELKLLTMGHKVQLTVLGLTQPPILVNVTKEPFRSIPMPISNVGRKNGQ